MGELQKRINKLLINKDIEKFKTHHLLVLSKELAMIVEKAKNTCPVWYKGEDERVYYPWEMAKKPQKYQLHSVDEDEFLKWFVWWFMDSAEK